MTMSALVHSPPVTGPDRLGEGEFVVQSHPLGPFPTNQP